MAGTKKPVDFTTRTVALTQDLAGRLTPTDFLLCIDTAAKQYSVHRPFPGIAEPNGNGTNDIALPTDFVDGFSRVDTVEYPIDSVPAVYVDDNEFEVFRKVSGLVLRLDTNIPTAAQKLRVNYTTYQLIGVDGSPGTPSTIPDADFEAVCSLAASYACLQISVSFSGGVDPSINADSVDGSRRADEFKQRSEELEQKYLFHLGLGSGRAGGGGMGGRSGRGMPLPSGIGQGFVDLDSTLEGSGADFLTHPKRWT